MSLFVGLSSPATMPLILAIFPLKRSIVEALRPMRIPPMRDAIGVKFSICFPPEAIEFV